MPQSPLFPDSIRLALDALPNWDLTDDRQGIRARYTFPDFAQALDFVNRVGALAETANHHPDFTLGWGYVTLTLSTHDAGGLTERDVAMAQEIKMLVANS